MDYETYDSEQEREKPKQVLDGIYLLPNVGSHGVLPSPGSRREGSAVASDPPES